MPPTAPFGRRAPVAPTRPPAPAASTSNALSDEAEAFRLALQGASTASEFESWRRSQRLGRWGAWALSFALAASGVLGFLLKAPLTTSVVLEVGGVGLGVWLRRARRRRIAAVAAWEPGTAG